MRGSRWAPLARSGRVADIGDISITTRAERFELIGRVQGIRESSDVCWEPAS
jgi:hypothetical protein